MDGLMDVLKQKVRIVGNVAGLASQKVKLKADIAFLERDIKNRQHSFGVQLYDYVAVWSARPEFFAANEDNILIATLRPPLIMAQREIAALHLKRTALKEKINVVTASRTASFNQKSDHWTETLQNAGRTTMFAGNEAKLKTELALVEREINQYKHMFGITIFQQFAMLEDTKGWLPTDREIRSFYDSCRKDIDNYKKRIANKENEIRDLDNKEKGIWTGDSASNEESTYAGPSNSQYNPNNNNFPPNNNPNGNLSMSTGIIDAQPPVSRYPPPQPQGPLPNDNTLDFFSGMPSSTHPLPPPPPQYASDSGLFRYANQQPNQQHSQGGGSGFDGF